MGTQHDCLCTNLTIVIHPQGPGPIVSASYDLIAFTLNAIILQVLNVNLSRPGMETIDTVPTHTVMGAVIDISGVHSAAVISGELDRADTQGTVLQPQNVPRYCVSFHRPVCIIIIPKLTHQFCMM
jgi:hypothetical protein